MSNDKNEKWWKWGLLAVLVIIYCFELIWVYFLCVLGACLLALFSKTIYLRLKNK